MEIVIEIIKWIILLNVVLSVFGFELIITKSNGKTIKIANRDRSSLKVKKEGKKNE